MKSVKSSIAKRLLSESVKTTYESSSDTSMKDNALWMATSSEVKTVACDDNVKVRVVEPHT